MPAAAELDSSDFCTRIAIFWALWATLPGCLSYSPFMRFNSSMKLIRVPRTPRPS